MYLTVKKCGKAKYIYLMESAYDKEKKKVVKKIIQNFGNYEEYIKNHPAEFKNLQEKYGNKADKAKNEKEEVLSKFIEDRKTSYLTEELLKNFCCLMPQNYSHLVLKRMWREDLRMQKFFDNLKMNEKLKFEYNISDICLYYVTLKIISPMSYLAGYEASPRFLGDPMSNCGIDDVYRGLHVLANYKDKIMRHINKRIEEISPREKSLIFYDCTNCYFETPNDDEYWYKKKARRILCKLLRKKFKELKHMSSKELIFLIDSTPEYTKMLEDIIEALGEPLRMYGPSKEKRTDLPLVSVALVIDDHAIPIDFEVFAGNKAETKTMIPLLKQMKNKYNISNAVLVADGALNGTQNLCNLLNEKLGFSVAKSSLSFSKRIRDNELNLEQYSKIKDDAGNETSTFYKIIDYSNTKYIKEKPTDEKSTKYTINCKMMITFNEKRKQRDLAIIEDNVKRAEQAVQNKEEITWAQSGWKQFVNASSEDELNTEPPSELDDELNPSELTNNANTAKCQLDKRVKTFIATSLNNDMIEKRKKCAGFASVLYHEPPDTEEKFSPSYISSMYHSLVRIEECFRIMKNEFEVRPLYVREQNSIKGHILLCVISLIIIRLIQRKFADLGKTITINEISDILKNLVVQTMYIDDTRCIYLRSIEALRRSGLCGINQEDYMEHHSQVSKCLMEILGGDLPRNVSTLGQLRQDFNLKSLSRSAFQTNLLKRYYSSQQAVAP